MTTIHPLYPYDSVGLAVMFVYGKDFQRHQIPSASASFRAVTISILIIWSLVAIILCAARRIWKQPRDGLFSSFIDTMIGFIAGGNLRMQSKFGRWFFGILLIGAFFINAIWTGNLLSYAVRLPDLKVTTLEQIAQIDPPIFLSYRRKESREIVYQILRFPIENSQFFFH